MITCKRCGRPIPMGVAACQNCGEPLTNSAGEAAGSSTGSASNMARIMGIPDQPQPELPAWLETLRSSERPNPSPSEAANFSADDLIDEDMLPGWMRSERKGMIDNSPSDLSSMRRSSSLSAPHTDSNSLPNRGMPASSLIDEHSLPSWLHEKPAASEYQENIAASSLVQPEAVPDWMKTIQPQSPTPATPAPIQYAQPTLLPQGITGSDLIDQQAVPQWLSSQDVHAPGSEQAGMSASSLLEASALPSWLREAEQEQKRGSTPSFPPPVQAGQAPVSQQPGNQSPYNQLSGKQDLSMNSSLAAASFIDVNALPDWLRSAEVQQQNNAYSPQQQGMSQNAGQALPARPDNVRVPSRPRGEVVPQEESAVAANVFASMLGVASAAPQFPGQPTRDASGYPQAPTFPAQPQQNISQQQWNNVTGMSPGSFPGTAGAPGYPGMPSNQGNAQMPGSPGSGGYPMGPMPGGMSPSQQPVPMNPAAAQSGPSMNSGYEQTKPKPARRGFLSTILDWFQFSR